ncbi:hypothetical protein UlMin_019870 [Ulmus minor]
MDKEIKVEVIGKEPVKPSTPTPNHLRSYKFSLLDQILPVYHNPVVLFFSSSNPSTDDPHTIASQTSQLLRKSLSKTLTKFPQIAGRIRENSSVECNDEGADFIETRINIPLSKILKKPDLETIKLLIPKSNATKYEVATACMLAVQANFFECGGIAIGVCLSHKLADASTISTFINSWAETTSESGNEFEISQLDALSLFPPHDSLASRPSPYEAVIEVIEESAVTRLVFNASRIAALKSKVAGGIVKNPTRVEAVIALILKCAMEAKRSSSGRDHHCPSVMYEAVNIRKRLVPNLPEKSIGNLVWNYAVKIEPENEIELQGLVSLHRKAIGEFTESCEERLTWEAICRHSSEMNDFIKSGDIEIYMSSSWCRFPFYEANFGWGEPLWVCLGSMPTKNFVFLIDTKDGDGIEAWLALSAEEMTFFERNQELLAFASLNPSAI